MNNHDDAYDRGLKLGCCWVDRRFRKPSMRSAPSTRNWPAISSRDAYGKVLSRGDLGLETRELCVIGALACRAHLPQLKWHIAAALNIGVTPAAIREVLIQSQPYAGWPTALNALRVMATTFGELGVAAEPAPPSDLSRQELRQRGRENGGRVYADFAAVEAAVQQYDSELADYLTENAYGQVYARPGITVQQRELVAVAMLTAQQQLTQLGWHIEGALRVGCSAAEIKEVIVTMLVYVGWPSTLNALDVWKKTVAAHV